MKAIVQNKFGGPDVLHIDEIDAPEPGAGEVQIKLAYAGLNPADWKDREGHLLRFSQPSFPYILGFDAAGVVSRVGEGVAGLREGDRVFGCTNHGQGGSGSYAEFVVASDARIAALPSRIDFRSAASLPVAALTAHQALHEHGRLREGERVLINGASGGVGGFLVQLAHHRGAEVHGICSTGNLDYVRALGAAACFDYTNPDDAAAIRNWADGKLDLIVDAVGYGTLKESLKLLRQGGKLISIATLLGDGDVEADCLEAARVGREKIFAIMTDDRAAEELTGIAELITRGAIQSPPVEIFPMERIHEAHALLEAGHVRGKLLLEVAGEEVC